MKCVPKFYKHFSTRFCKLVLRESQVKMVKKSSNLYENNSKVQNKTQIKKMKSQRENWFYLAVHITLILCCLVYH
jgi:hypothetical protein